MKTKLIILSGLALLMASCSSTSNLVDDVYYSQEDDIRAGKTATGYVAEANAVNEAISADQGFDAVGYTEPKSGVIAVYEGDTLELETFEYENGDKEVIVNNYYDYGTRLSRFYGPSVGMGYYSPYYNPWYYDPWYWGPTFSFSIGYGFGWGYPYYGYGYPYYGYPRRPWYGGYCCGYYGGYYGGYYPVYIVGGEINSDAYYYGRRRSSSTARAGSYDRDYAKSSYYDYNSTDRRRGSTSTTAVSSRSSESVKAANVSGTSTGRRRYSDNSTTKAGSIEGVSRTIPKSAETSVSQSNRRSSVTSNRNAESVTTTRVIPNKSVTSSTYRRANTPTRTQSVKTNTNTNTQRRYVPRYSNPKTTTKPTYNSSSSKSYNNRSSTVRRSTYKSPTRRSSSTYSSPSRSSSGSSYRSSGYRSSGSSVRSSGSSGRSSGTSSRSSSGSGRRR